MATAASPGLVKTPRPQESPPQHHGSDGGAASPGRSAKRQKVTRACDSCKSRKRRCTGELPCSACYANNAKCTYLATYTRGRLVEPVPAAHAGNDAPTPHLLPSINPYLTAPTNGAESNGRPSRATSPDVGTFAGQYLGPTSPYVFLRRAWKRFEQDGANSNFAGGSTEEPSQSEPIFAFGDRQGPAVDLRDFQLPRRSETSLLLSQYFDFAMPTYRFFHKQTVAQWLEEYHQLEENGPESSSLPPCRQGVVLMIMACARLFNIDENREKLDPDETSYREAEKLFRLAHKKLDEERGRARLESVQARMAASLFFLHTSRPNQAWYQFGKTVQIALALGLHRATAGPTIQQDCIMRECRKRTFWAISTLDTYLSVVLGRPPLIHLDDVDQKLPDAIDDEDLTPNGAVSETPARDSIIKASIMHARITRIVKKAAREQYSVQRKSTQQKLETATKLNAETAMWHASLPVVLSGAIHPSSLIPIFRRQITVLQLAHGHAQMLINRPSLLLESTQVTLRETQVEACLLGAKLTLNTVLAAGFSKHIFQAFWYTQFVSFNALSIVYVWLIQRKHGRLPALKSVPEEEIVRLAETVQKRLNEASEANAPSLRYSIVLEELQQEVQRTNAKVTQRPPHVSGLIDNAGSLTDSPDMGAVSMDSISSDPLMEALASDFPLDPDLWLSLDSFPFSDFGQIE